MDRLANAVFVLCCVALLGVTAARAWRPAPDARAAREQVIRTGAPDPFALPEAVTAPARGHPLVCVLIGTACPICAASLPFYRRLTDAVAANGGASGLVFVGIEPERDLRAYLEKAGFAGARVASIARPREISGTPTIVALDAAHRVTRSWAGRLSPAQEADVVALVSQRAAAPPARASDVTQLLEAARARLSGTRDIRTVSDLDLAGTETLLRDTGSRENPYAVTLAWPDTLHLQAGPVIHVLSGGVYSRRVADPARFGGPIVDRLLTDAESIRTAAAGMRSHLLRLSLTYLARAPAGAVVQDEGLRDFGGIKGRTMLFKDPAGAQAELVLDPFTSQPLGVVTPVHTVGGAAAGSDGLWISIPADYRDVSGVRIPHRVEDWIDVTHARVVLTSVTVK